MISLIEFTFEWQVHVLTENKESGAVLITLGYPSCYSLFFLTYYFLGGYYSLMASISTMNPREDTMK